MSWQSHIPALPFQFHRELEGAIRLGRKIGKLLDGIDIQRSIDMREHGIAGSRVLVTDGSLDALLLDLEQHQPRLTGVIGVCRAHHLQLGGAMDESLAGETIRHVCAEVARLVPVVFFGNMIDELVHCTAFTGSLHNLNKSTFLVQLVLLNNKKEFLTTGNPR